MKLTRIDYFYNTPFTDFQNTIHFDTEDERDNFFTGRYNMKSSEEPFNFVKDRLMLRTRLSTLDTYGLNYLRFINGFDSRYYYCYVVSTRYINDNVTELGLVVDVKTTFMCGDITQYMHSVGVNRMMLTESKYDLYKELLESTDDVPVAPLMYTHQEKAGWKDFGVIFTCSSDLTSSFGTEDDPQMKTSKGQEYDEIVSPVDLWVCKKKSDFVTLMKDLKNYPWIAQNIDSVALVPMELVDEKDLTQLTNATESFCNKILYRFKNGHKTSSIKLEKLSHDFSALPSLFGFPDDVPKWCLSGKYAKIELTDFAGHRVELTPAYLPDSGLNLYMQATFGYHNQIRVIPDQYLSYEENSVTGLYRGSYANSGIDINNFSDIPVLVDNYKLSYASTAHQRELGNERTLSGRLNHVFGSGYSLSDRFANAVALTSAVTSISGALNAFSSEYEHYRDLNAQVADMSISAPSVGMQDTSQAFSMAHDTFGVVVKYQSITRKNLNLLLRYRGKYGFGFNGRVVDVTPLGTSPIMDYLSVTGNITLPNVPSQFSQQISTELENGIFFWKNNGTDNPFVQDLSDNYSKE